MSEKKFLRSHVNTFFGITCDKDFAALPPGDQDEMDQYEVEGIGLGPRPPYVPNWENVLGSWNISLADLFLQYVHKEEDSNLSDSDAQVYGELFMERLQRVSRLVRNAAAREGESIGAANARVEAYNLRRITLQRRHTRRLTVRERSKSSIIIWRADQVFTDI